MTARRASTALAFFVYTLFLSLTASASLEAYPQLPWMRGHDECFAPIPRFPCQRHDDGDAPPPPPAQDVHHLHPRDIKAIAVIGDSIAAGLFAETWHLPFSGKQEYRYHAFSNGGREDRITLANLFRFYSPDVVGMSYAKTGIYGRDEDSLNMAITGSSSSKLMWQVGNLTERLRNDQRYNHTWNQWKLLTIWAGVNDVCRKDDVGEAFKQNMRQVLNTIRQDIPKVFVNIVTYFNIGYLPLATDKSRWCRISKSTVRICPVLTLSHTAPKFLLVQNGENMDVNNDAAYIATRKHFQSQLELLNESIEQIAAEYSQLNDPHFAVRLQPSLQPLDNSILPGSSYVSKLDCFHPNRCAHELFAMGLWNAMFREHRAREKHRALIDGRWFCPGVENYLK